MSNKELKTAQSAEIEKRRPKWGMFFAGMLWGAVLAFILGVVFLRSALILEYKSGYDFKTTISKIAESAKATGWIVKRPSCSLPAPCDGSAIASLRLCRLKYANELLADEKERKISAMIPCTIAVYTRNDGQTYIAKANMGLISQLLGGTPGKVFPHNIEPEQERIISSVIRREAK